MIVCTSICANYLPKAAVLAGSLKAFNPDVKFVVCLVEETEAHVDEFRAVFDHVVLARDLGMENFPSFMFRHSIVEASTAVKGFLFLYLLKNFPDEEHFCYFDPDIQVFGPLAELSDVLTRHDIVLTPHLCEPESTIDAILDNEICALKHGVFNLGFLGVRRSETARRFLEWWASRLERFCYADIPNGLFTDQRWIDLAPCFFDVHVFRHPGYNIAPWNLSRRTIARESGEGYRVNGEPLRFFHFSGFDSGANELMVNKYCPDRNDPVYEIRNRYVALLEDAGQERLGAVPWSYDTYEDGTRIEENHRLQYRAQEWMQHEYRNPFSDEFRRLWHHAVITPERRTLLHQISWDLKTSYREGGIFLIVKRTVNKMIRSLKS